MKEYILKILNSEVFLTILSGTLVYILSQCWVKFIINPSKEFRKLKQKIIYNLKMYSRYYSNPYNLLDINNNEINKEEYDKAHVEIRKVGIEVASYIGVLPRIKFRKRKKMAKICDALIGLSNGLYVFKNHDPRNDNKKNQKIIEKELNYY